MVSTKEVKVVFWLQQVKLGKRKQEQHFPRQSTRHFFYTTGKELLYAAARYLQWDKLSYWCLVFRSAHCIFFSTLLQLPGIAKSSTDLIQTLVIPDTSTVVVYKKQIRSLPVLYYLGCSLCCAIFLYLYVISELHTILKVRPHQC